MIEWKKTAAKTIAVLGCSFMLAIGCSVGLAAEDKTQASMKATKPVGHGTLIVHLTGLKNDMGVVRIGLFNTQQAYETKEHPELVAFRKATLPIKNDQATWTIQNVPYGEYTIKTYHDVNDSGKLDVNFIGIPKEEVGFSDNPSFKNKMPAYEKVKFEINQPKKEMNIHLVAP